MKKQITVDGNEACSYTAYMFTEVAGIYPITPSSTMAEHIDEWSNNDRLNMFGDKVKVIEMQSEAGAAGLMHGALQAGCLTTTFTASQGLLLMIPNMYKIAGEMLPCVIHVAARSIATHALSIMGDHQDVYATRQTGFCMLASSSVQDATYMAGIAHLSAIKASLPFLHFFDGFRTSHELQKINVLEMEDYEDLVDKEAIINFRNRALNVGKSITRGTNQNDDIYFQATEVRNKFYDEVLNIVNDYMKKLNKIAGTDYAPFNYYGSKKATSLIVAMGSVCETIKETVTDLNKKGYEVGLVEVHLYRPFSTKYLLDVIPDTVEKIAVMDRTKEAGSNGEPLYLDVVSALKDTNIKICGGRYGLSSKNTTPAQIKAVFDMLEKDNIREFTVGINDDVTHLSLPVDETYKISDAHEFLIYGFGSDGMVSASKSIMKIIGDNTDNYVQGYFQYDSKKSGGVTVEHLRFKNKPIQSTYYVENPQIVVVTKDSYLRDFDVLTNIRQKGIFILNTIQTKEEIIASLSEEIKSIIANKQLKFYIINAYELARKTGLKNKISTIMASVIFNLTNIIDYNLAKVKLKEIVKHEFGKKGEEIVRANYQAIDEAIDFLQEIKLTDESFILDEKEEKQDVFNMMMERRGNDIPVSAFLDNPDGTFPGGKSTVDKKGISDLAPKWLSENCIQCNQCSFVCPHSVIRPFLLSEEEYDKAPYFIQERCKKALGGFNENYYYAIAVSILNCTGCGLCIKTCPGMKGNKALTFEKTITLYKNKEQEVADYLFKNISDKGLFKKETIKGSQFIQPKFMFHSACAGCGETSYIRLLTQLFGDHMIIANATGCSSIYGGTVPETSYTIPWANSLFEDNAEFGYGILVANNVLRNRIANIMSENLDGYNGDLFREWLENSNNYEITKKVYDNINYRQVPKELKELKEYIPYRSIWTIGGDGWAYDIGFGGIDQVISSNEDVNILVLDSQVYSNTGGQASKSTPKGSIAAFASDGKQNNRKDITRMLLAYPHVYVATVSLGANQQQLIKALTEAENYKGPSIIFAYSTCIAHGIKGGLENTLEMQRLASECGYFPLFRYNPDTKTFTLDSKNVDFEKYREFLLSQNRYAMLQAVNPEQMEELLETNKKNAMERYEYYKNLEAQNESKQ